MDRLDRLDWIGLRKGGRKIIHKDAWIEETMDSMGRFGMEKEWEWRIVGMLSGLYFQEQAKCTVEAICCMYV